MITTTPLTRDLLRALGERSRDRFAGVLAGTPQAEALCLRTDGWAQAAFHGDRLVAGYGVVPLWVGRAEAWMLVCGCASDHVIGRVTLRGRQFLDDLQMRHRQALNRIEMWCPADAPWTLSFARALGFRHEGTARAYGPDGSCYALFSRLVDD